MRRCALLTIAILALWPAVASAEAPAAVDESVPLSNPTTISLEATVAGTTEMTFAIASAPARGSLGPISSPTCQPTGTGSTECEANVTYTPEACTSGPDAFTYTATDTGTSATSAPATITLQAPEPVPVPASTPPQPSLAPTAVTSAGAPFSATVSNAVVGATAEYGDGSGLQPLSVDAAGDAALSHTYAAEGTYWLTVANRGACSTSISAMERVDVLAPGTLGLTSAIAPPGGNASIAIPGALGLTATLFAAPTDRSAEILAAIYPPTSSLFAAAAAHGQVVGAYDVRVINVSSNDSAVVSFSFPDGGIPTAATLLYFDPQAQSYVPVHPSTLAANPLSVDVANHTVTIVFDHSSVPSITDLVGTRFALIAAPPAITRLAVTPRCVATGFVRLLRLHLSLSEKAALGIRVHRRAHARPPARCTGHSSRIPAHAGRKIVRLHRRHLRPGIYEVTLTARNIHGSSHVTRTFVVAASARKV